LFRQLGPVLGEAPEIFVEPKARLVAPTQLVLSSDYRKNARLVAGQFRVMGEVVFDSGFLSGLQSQFQIDMRTPEGTARHGTCA
jgi:hypothetical protein